MLTCRYTNDINKTIHFEKNCKNVGRKLRCFTNVLKTMTTLIHFFFLSVHLLLFIFRLF
jgi:hypothetical protein